MGACCPKPKRSAADAGSEDNAPLMSAQNGITGNKGRPISCTPSEPESKDTDERAVYNQIIDETQGQIIDVMSLDQRSTNMTELIDRAGMYHTKLQSLANESILPPNLSPNLQSTPKFALIPDSQFALLPQVSSTEISFMNDILRQFEEAYDDISVKQTEPLITPLMI